MVFSGAMVKCGGGKDSDSVALDRPLKLWSLIIDSVRCGGGGGGGIQGHSRRKKGGAKKQPGSEKLSELLKQPEWWENEEVRRKEEALGELKMVGKELQGESMAAVVEAAAEVRRLTKDDPEARTTLALLGAIPPLVALLDGGQDPSFNSQITALYALLNLAIGNDANKSAIVKAGAVHKMLKLVRSPNGAPNTAVSEAVVANFLGLSALDSNKPIIGSSGSIPFLVETLQNLDENVVGSLAKTDSLRALYNLSILTLNVYTLLETDLVSYLVTNLGDMDVSEIILSILSNVVAVSEGRKRIGAVPDAFPILVDVLNWTDSPGCQEKATYILIVMAHKSYGDRHAMIDSGIISSLLELTLLGTPLAQKRASRMLESLRVDKGKQVSSGGGGGAVSAPLIGTSLSMESDRRDESLFGDEDEMMSQEKKAVKQLVQQSLHNNMKRMVKRANLPHDFVPSDHFKSLTLSSTSKSLPF